jgi:hypothetical protein
MAASGPLGEADPQALARKLEGENRWLKARNIVLEAELRQKDEKLKEAETRGGAPGPTPPNSDMPSSLVIGGGSGKSKRGAGPSLRKRGPRHGREPFKEGEDGTAVAGHEDPNGGVCPCRGGRLERSPEHDGVHGQYELKERIAGKLIRKSKACKFRKRRKLLDRSVPLRIIGTGLAGIRLLARMIVMKVAGHDSVRQITAGLGDVAGVKMSRGTVNNALKRGARAFPPAFLELLHALPPAPALIVDETHFDVMGKKLWMWVFVTAVAALFRIGPRSGEVPESVLKDSLPRVIACDRCRVYGKWAGEHPGQEPRRCRARLDREFRRRADRLDPEIGRFGKAAQVKPAVVFRPRRKLKGLEAPGCPEAMRLKALVREAFERPGRRAAGAPRIRNAKACALAKRFEQGFGSYTRFIGIPGAGPTNSAAERALRHAALDRKNSCGAQSGEGALFLEIMRAAFATTRMRCEAFFQFIA